MAKGRVIALKFAGRNLTAAPEGYTSRTEACVKRWLSRLPKPLDATPDDVQSIQDAYDSEVDLASLDAMRHSVEGEEKPEEIEGDQTLPDAAGSVADEAVQQEPQSQQNISLSASPGDDGTDSSTGEPSAKDAGTGMPVSKGNQERPGSASFKNCADVEDDRGSTQGSQHAEQSQTECVAPHAELNAAVQGVVAVAHLMDSSAVEIGIERYLGMAEASKMDRESILQEALRLAVSDRINTRMAHMADTAKLAEQCKKAEDKVLERQAAVEANIALQQEVTDLKRKQHWDQLKAREDVFCAQQQLEAGRTALKDAMSTMENRISTLTTQGQELGREKRDLEVKLASASHEVTKLRSNVALLEQQLVTKAVECTALNAELRDNLHRWEQESMQRIEAEEQLEGTKEELRAALEEGKKATKAASLKGRAHETAVRELMSCRARHRSLLSAKAALEDEASGSAGAGSPARKVQRERLTNHSVVPIKRPLADKNSADTVNSTAHEAEQAVVAVDPRNSKHQTTTGSALGFADNQQVAPSANSEQPSDGKGATAEKTGTELSNAPPTQRKSTKPDAQALRLQDQLLHQAFSSAPPALKALKLALRCIIVTQPGNEELATRLADQMSPHYRTLTCVVTEKGGTAAATEARLACVDEHTVHVLFPVSHKAIFVELQPSFAKELQQLAREQRLPAATFTMTEHACHQSSEGTDSTQDELAQPTDDVVTQRGDSSRATVEFLPESTAPGMKFSEIGWDAAVEKIQSWVGVPDNVLECVTVVSLKSLYKGHGNTHLKLQPAQRVLLDLTTFSTHGATYFSLQDSSVSSCASGTELSPGEPRLEDLDDMQTPHCTSITNATQLAQHLLMHNHCITQLNLNAVSITEHTARLLAEAVLRSSNSRIESIVLSQAALPVGLLIGRSLPRENQQPEVPPLQMSNATAVTLSSSMTDTDLAFITELLEHTPASALRSLTLSDTRSVSTRLLESFALAVGKLQNLESLQGVFCDSLKGLNGMLCPTRVGTAETSAPDAPLGTFGALVAAQLLAQSWKSPTQCTHEEVHGNVLDGVVDGPCDGRQQHRNREIQTVNLSGTELGALGSERMALALGSARFCSSMQLQLPCTAPGRQGCKGWAAFISGQVAPSMTALDLSSNNLDDTQLLELTHALGLCTQLEVLNLSGNSIVCKGVLALSQELLQNVPLRSLNLANNSLADRAGVVVAGLLLPSSACSFSHLQLSGNCSLGISTAARLAQVLPYTTSLKSLDLSRTQLNGQALPQLARALQANQALVFLDISSCKIGVWEVRNLSEALNSNTTLCSLRMSKNSIGDQGTAAIGTLITNISLTYINLSHCCIRTCGAQWLAEVLPRSQCLQHLDVSSNGIGDIGAAALMQSCGNLTKLDLSCTDMSSSGLSSVASHLSANSAKIKLRSLNLSRNQFGDKAMAQICAAISSNTQLQTISLSGCRLGSAGGRRLLNLVQSIRHSEAVSRRRHLLQEVTVSHNSRMDSVIATSIKEALRSRFVQNEGRRAPAPRRAVLSTYSGFRRANVVDGVNSTSGSTLTGKVGRGSRRGSKKPTEMMFERFTEKAIKVVMLAQEESRRLGHNFVGTEQILLGLIGEATGIAAKVLKSMGVTLKDSRTQVEKIIGRGSGFVAVEIPFTPRAKRVLELSLEEARQLGHSYIGTEHILLGLLREGEGIAARVLEALGAQPEKIRNQVIRMVGESQEPVGASVGGAQGGANKTPTLEEYGTNLTQQAEEGKLDPVVGRKSEIERVIQILGRRTKNNPCLIGEPGVGKTAVAEGLAQKISQGDVPETIEGKRVITLDMGLLVAGTKYRGEFEERLKKLMEEIKQNDDIILMIDEVHTLIGAGAAEGAIDAANILKPALARGELQCMGATTLDEYRKHIEKDPALERRFQPVRVNEPTVDETYQILGGLRERYEAHHKLRYTDEALMAAATYSHQYISDRFLPDKAIDLIDEAGSRVRLRHAQLPEEAREVEKELRKIQKEKDGCVRTQEFEKAGDLRDREVELKSKIDAIVNDKKAKDDAESDAAGDGGPMVNDTDIANIVAQWTGIPVEKVSADETERLINMESVLHGRVIGQEEAVVAISRAIRRARVGLKNPNRPIASFIFSGPTGVGKSELAKTLAAYYFGSEEAMVRLDMSEYMERHTVAKLIGSPPGYVGYNEGGQLTEAVRRRPYTVVLFDEVEKAHPDVFNMMLQILEDGRLTDSKGRTVDFKNTLIIMTSNVGSSVIEKGGGGLGFQLDSDNEEENSYNRIKNLVMEELKQYFRPEFLNRLDEIIVFRQLTKSEVKQIADIMLKGVTDRAKTKEITIDLTERFKDRLVDEGFNPAYGARPLRRAIQRLLEDALAERMLGGDISEGDSVIMDVDAEGNITVLNGDKTMVTTVGVGNAGIS